MNLRSPSRRRFVGASLGLGLAWPALGAPLPPMQVWKSPSCGCCKDWIALLQRDGFELRVFDEGNNAMRAKLGLPHAEPLSFLLIRYLLVLGLMTVVALATRARWPHDARHWFHIGVSGLLVHGIYLGGVYIAIAKGLPARLHRITAMAMACEVCVADELIHEGELTFLEQLRLALRIAPYEAQDIFAAAQAHRTAAYIDDRLLRLRSLIAVAIEMFTVRAVTLGKLIDDHRFELRDFLVALPDLALRQHEIEGMLYQSFKRPRVIGVEAELAAMAADLPDPVDRYWMVVYAMCAEPPADLARWRVIPFISLAQRAFGIGDADMDLAVSLATGMPIVVPTGNYREPWIPAWVEGAVQTALNAVWGVVHHLGGGSAHGNPGPGDRWDELQPLRLPDQ